MIHRLFATPNRRVIIALVMVLVVLNALVFIVVRTREMTIARLQLNQNLPNDLTRVTASASTDVQVTLESNITSLAASEREVPVKIMVSKPAATVLSSMAVSLKYDTDKLIFDRFESDSSCNMMQQTTPTPTISPTPMTEPTSACGGTASLTAMTLGPVGTVTDGATATDYKNMQLYIRPKSTQDTSVLWNLAAIYQRPSTTFYNGEYTSLGVSTYTIVTWMANGSGQIGAYPAGSVRLTIDGLQRSIYFPSFIIPDGSSQISFYVALDGSTYYAHSSHAAVGADGVTNSQILTNSVNLTPAQVFDSTQTHRAQICNASLAQAIGAPQEILGVMNVSADAGKNTQLTLVGAGVLDANASSQMVTAVQKTSGDTQPGTANFCLAKAIFKTKSDFTSGTGRIEVVASGGDTRIETVPLTGTTMGIIEGQQYVEVTKADPGYTIASPAYDLRMTGTVALMIKKSVEQIKRGDDFYIDIMAKPTVPEGAFVGMSALEFDFGYGAVIGTDGVPTSKVFITKFDTSSSSECSILEHVLPSVTDGYTVVSQRPSIRYSKAGHTNFPTTEFCVGRIYMKAMETGQVQMIIKTGDGVALDARGRKMVIQSTNGIAESISLNIESNTIVDPSCEALKLNVDTEDQQTYVRPQQAVVISMNTGLAYKILADKGTGIALKNPPKKFTYTAPATEGPDRIQIWRTDNTYCEPEIAVQSNANGSVSLLDGVFIDPNKVSVRMKIRPQGVIKGRLPYTKLKVAISAGGLPTNNNLIDPVSNEFVSIGDGMFEGVITFDPRYIKPGKGYKLTIKGSKHLAKRICEPEPNKSKTKPDSAYTCPKDNAGVFEFKNGLNGPYDFSQVFLPAGDLFIDRQDGVIDSTDLTFIRKNLGSQDPEKLRIGDINMDGQIDTQDYLITISNVVNNLDEN